MKDKDLNRLLDECIDRMNRGEPLEEVLAGCPDEAERLRPLLEAAYGLKDTVEPVAAPESKRTNRRKLQQALNARREKVERRGWALAPVVPVVGRQAALVAVSSVLLVALVAVGLVSVLTGGAVITPPTGINNAGGEIAAFESEAALVAYLQESDELYSSGAWGVGGVFRGGFFAEESSAIPVPAPNDQGASIASGDGYKDEADRVSGTNVQVLGIDEPDIVKTDGSSIFFSHQDWWFYGGIDIEVRVAGEEGEIWPVPPVEDRSGIEIIDALPPENISVIGDIDLNGDLLLHDGTLMVFAWDSIVAYDVTDPQSPTEKWQIDIQDDTSTVAARLYNGKVYLVTQTWLNTYDPVPIVPMKVDGVPVEIGYSSIYYPIAPVPADATYNAMVVNPDTGAIESSMSFVGQAYTSEVYMSSNAIYITYTYQENIVPLAFDFCINYCQGLLPETIIGRIQTLQGYDISDTAKLTEIQVIIGDYLNSLESSQRAIVENDLANRLEDYYDLHKRDLERTGIVKIDLAGFTTSATGSVPGSVLNQFSLDEYNGYLRIATTVGDTWGGTFMGIWWFSSDSANDVYVLDGSLNVVGAVQDLGLTEQIYAVRFIGDEGYVVTFRQVDPFYVLDLSNPQAPQLKGELKIPGYSSYLHPITDDIILGIGQEGWKVKLSLFDVSVPENPVEIDKYTMIEGWSDVSSTHHAFLLDEKHQVFFLPAGEGGYVFSYTGNQMTLVTAVTDIQARRALYLDDYLYIVGDERVVVLDEVTWEQVSELEF